MEWADVAIWVLFVFECTSIAVPQSPAAEFPRTIEKAAERRGWVCLKHSSSAFSLVRGIRREKRRSSRTPPVSLRLTAPSGRGPFGRAPHRRPYRVPLRPCGPPTGAYRLVLAGNSSLDCSPGARLSLHRGGRAGAGADLPPQRRPYEGEARTGGAMPPLRRMQKWRPCGFELQGRVMKTIPRARAGSRRAILRKNAKGPCLWGGSGRS